MKRHFILNTEDFGNNTFGMSLKDKGQYMDILCHLYSYGPISIVKMQVLFGDLSDKVKNLLKQDEKGNWYDPRLVTTYSNKI